MSRTANATRASLEDAINQYTYIVETPGGSFIAYKSLSAARGAVTARVTKGWGRNKEVGSKEGYKIHKVHLAVAEVEVLHG